MKAIIFLLAVLSVLGISHSAVVKAPLSAASPLKCNVNLGHIHPGDRLLHRSYLYQPAIAHVIQYHDFVLRIGRARISAIRVNEVGYAQYATPTLLSGGIGYNNVSIRVRSAIGYGYFFSVEIWGR